MSLTAFGMGLSWTTGYSCTTPMLGDRQWTGVNTLRPNCCSLHLDFFLGERLGRAEPDFIRGSSRPGARTLRKAVTNQGGIRNDATSLDDKPNPVAT